MNIVEIVSKHYLHFCYFAKNMPLLFWSAAAFYVLAIFAIACPALRRKIPEIFKVSGSAEQSAIAPLDSFRGLAALWVFCFHSWLFMWPVNNGLMWVPLANTGQMAVPCFAVLSGFLVYRSIRNKCDSRKDIAEYAKRRFLRIYPLYFVTTILVLLFSFAGIGALKESMRYFIADIFMLRIFGVPDFCGKPLWNTPAWSLYVEAVFYIALPVFVMAARKRILLASILGFCLFSAFGVRDNPMPFLVFKFFFIGMILCEIEASEAYRNIRGHWAGLMLAGGLCLFTLALLGRPVIDSGLDLVVKVFNRTPFYATYTWRDNFSITLGAAAFLMILGTMKFPPACKLMSFYPLRFIGVISYSLYLCQLFLIRMCVRHVNLDAGAGQGGLTTFVILFIPAMVLYASISYALIERPFLKLRAKRKKI